MKGHLKLLKSLDNKLNAAYASAQKSFAGRVLLKLTSEVILACLLAFAVYVATNTYHRSTAISEDNQKLKHIYISISDEYNTDLFGTPYITFDNNTLTNKFYILNKAILRTVVDKGNVVAFFITSTSSQIDIPVDSFENDTREIGNTTYDSIDFANPQIESNASANGRYNYYGEIQETGRYGMWNYYLFGTLPYGFDDDSAINLLMLTAFDDSPDQNQVEILRKTAKPNTFAIIASDYYDHISLLPISDEWENIYHLLIRAQSD